MSDQDLSAVLPRIRPVRGAEEVARLVELAKADQHTVLGATHLVERGGELLGYFSLAGIPAVHVWLDSKKVGPRESIRMLNTIESVAADRRWSASVWLCASNSPFYPVMGRLGFQRLGETTMFLKGH